MSKILVINAGSSSIKFQLRSMPDETLITSGLVERIGLKDGVFKIKYHDEKIENIYNFEDHEVAFNYILRELLELKIIDKLEEITACGHRITHGGESFKGSAIVTPDVVKEVARLQTLAPLHNPVNLIGYNIITKLLPTIRNVFVFDTSFHSTIEESSYIYPIPYDYYMNHEIRKYGFHGTSHKFVSEIALNNDKNNTRMITCHIGNGVSVTAIKDGKSINTSMGITPLGGAMMGTRSGDIDPAIVEIIDTIDNITVKETINILNKKSGLLGVSGISSDAREVIDSAKKGDKRAILALDIYTGRIRNYIGRYTMQLKGLDAIVFTAGVGENSAYIRKLILDGVKDALNIDYDNYLNDKNGDDNGLITTINSKVKVYVIPTNEELVIARDTYNLIKEC